MPRGWAERAPACSSIPTGERTLPPVRPHGPAGVRAPSLTWTGAISRAGPAVGRHSGERLLGKTDGGWRGDSPPTARPPPTHPRDDPQRAGARPGGGVRGGRGREGAGGAYRAMSLAAFYYKPSEGVGVTPGSLENSAAGFPRRFSNL